MPMNPLPLSDDLNAVPPRFAACRTLKHAWEPASSMRNEIDGMTELQLVCLRCGSERHDTISHHGVVRGRRYAYPEGYLRQKGTPKLYAPDYRLRLLELSLSEITIRRS